MSIKAIGFDYGGVIGGVHTSGPSFAEKVCMLLEIDNETRRNVYFSLNSKIALGEIETWREFWKLFLDKIGRSDMLDKLMILNDEEDRKLQIINNEIISLIDTLRKNGYKIGLLSNTTLEAAKTMRAKNLDTHFDVFHISAETKRMKPDLGAYLYFANDLGVDIRELAFVDDSEIILSSAEDCGYTPILYAGVNRLKDQLRTVGVTT